MQNLSVVVVGAGMGGLTAAIALRRAGYEVHVYEQAPAIAPIGAGISLWPNGVKVMSWLGLGAEVERAGVPLLGMQYRDARGELLTEIPMQPLVDAVGERPYPISRADLHAILTDALGVERLTLDALCVGVEQDEHGATAIFADGRRARGDVLVGADGIRSTVRAQAFPEAPAPRYAGNVTWVGLVDQDAELNGPGLFTLYVGERKRLGVMPVGDGKLYVFLDAAMPPGAIADGATSYEVLRALFAGWCAPVVRLVERLDPATIVPLEIHDMDPLPHVARGRVALLGDAAHAATPSLGQNGAQAMEDAVVLTQALVTTSIGVEDALRRYEQQRRERTAAVVRHARARTDVMFGAEPGAAERWYEALREQRDGEFVALQTRVILEGPLR
ncbi:MAG TPA: FAD-dependent monooxygenase [Conexibacter sp.]|nr:FAD-dependent monooxygenase [Conexibacter sp.]